MAVRLVIIGGGPAGNTAATVAASIGAEVTMIERDIIGGAAHLWDCIPSKALVATGNELTELALAKTMGLEASGRLDVDALRVRISEMEEKLRSGVTSLLESQGVRLIRGTGRLTGAYTVAADTAEGTEELEADAILLSTGSRPRVPDWAETDGERILTTRQAYPPPEIPDHLVVIGSGVTGVEQAPLPGGVVAAPGRPVVPAGLAGQSGQGLGEPGAESVAERRLRLGQA